MKHYRLTVLIPVILMMAYNSQAQCSNQLKTLTYDTTVNAWGNSFNTFSVPRFNPLLGTLASVLVETKVTLIYNFKLENGEVNPVSNYRVKVFREDEITSSVLRIPLSNFYQKQYGFFSLAGNDGVPDSGPDFTQQGPLYVMNQMNIPFTVLNTADFFGTGLISFDYTTNTYSAAQGSINNNLFGSAQDMVNFKVTYVYCPQILLSADITGFNANKINDNTIDIRWNTHNEKNNQKYEVQKSTDGKFFGNIAQFTAKANATQTGSYTHSYQVSPTDNNQTLLFRIKQVDADGTARYSSVQAVKLNTNAAMQPRIFPNPATGATNMLFSNNKRGNWEVSVYGVSGQLLKRYNFNNALSGKLNTGGELEKGIYMVRSVNKSTDESFVQQLIIQ